MPLIILLVHFELKRFKFTIQIFLNFNQNTHGKQTTLNWSKPSDISHFDNSFPWRHHDAFSRSSVSLLISTDFSVIFSIFLVYSKFFGLFKPVYDFLVHGKWLLTWLVWIEGFSDFALSKTLNWVSFQLLSRVFFQVCLKYLTRLCFKKLSFAWKGFPGN